VSAGDNIRDDRWRPGFVSSERRVREELADAAEQAQPTIYSRELSFVPAQSIPKFEAHDAQTQAMIDEHNRLERLRHGPSVLGRLDQWKWMDAMNGAREKQQYLEPLIAQVRRDPPGHEDVLLFLLIAFEPIRRGVSKRFLQARGGIGASVSTSWRDRTQARTIREIERQTLYDVTREAILEAIFLYPTPPPEKLFPWFRTVASRHALIQLHKDLTDNRTPMSVEEAAALQAALVGLDDAEAPPMRERIGPRHWRGHFNVRDLYETVEAFYSENGIRSACTAAIGRLPRGQAEVITGRFFRDATPADLALERKVSRSTIYNHTTQALKNMEKDECFFTALFELGILRDQVRRAQIAARYPDGRLPDGRRIVAIDQAA
jgi:DNA-directed RNA polymerase specialized sigma24 family protein